MSKSVEPYVVLLGKTTIIKENIRFWLEHLGVDDPWIQSILNDNKTDAQRLIECAGRRCYMSFQPKLNPNVTKIREDIHKYLTNVLASGHGSVLEHVSFTFAIENVSRVFTGEMNRHRAGWAISEGSMRYIRYNNIPYWTPPSFTGGDTPCPTGDDGSYWGYPSGRPYESKEEASRNIMLEAFLDAEKHYKNLSRLWKEELAPESSFHKKKEITSAMRRIIPMGVATGGLWTGNVRALRHVLEIRSSEGAEEEICLVAGMMLNTMREVEPILFGDFVTDSNGFSKPKYSKV